MKKRWLVLAAVSAAFLLAVPIGQAQTLYGVDPLGGLVVEFTMPPGAPCAAPAYFPPPWPYPFPVAPPCPVPPPFPTASPANSIAVNKVTDTIFVSDGFVIQEYMAGAPVTGPAGTPIDAYFIPPLPPMGPPIAMCWDSAGAILYLTDGFLIAGLGLAPGGCAPPPLAVPPFPHLLGPVFLSDITFDPVTGGGTLWGCDIAGGVGLVSNIVIGAGGLGPGGAFVSGFPVPVGVAFDSATPVLPPAAPVAPHVFVSDGFTVVHFDTTTGLPAVFAPFYAPVFAGPTPVFIDNLAFSGHGYTYGVPPGAATLGMFGQSTTPSATFGLTLTGGTPGDFIWVLANFSFPGPGFVCPPGVALSNPLWVSTAPPALIFPFAPVATPVDVFFPAPLPAALPVGLSIFVQFWMDSTPAAPGGPWLATEGLEFTIMAP